jgi:hypothetical protein
VSHLGSRAQSRTAENHQGATRHASSEEAVGVAFVLGSVEAAASGGRAALTEAAIKGTRKGPKGSKKGQKPQPDVSP